MLCRCDVQCCQYWPEATMITLRALKLRINPDSNLLVNQNCLSQATTSISHKVPSSKVSCKKISLCRREACVPLDPAPNLVHHLFSHMTSHGVGGGSGLLPTFDGHKEVAEAGIQDKLHVTQ